METVSGDGRKRGISEEEKNRRLLSVQVSHRTSEIKRRATNNAVTTSVRLPLIYTVGGQGSWLVMEVMEVVINYCGGQVETCLRTATCLTFRRHRCDVKLSIRDLKYVLLKWHRTKVFRYDNC